MPLGRGCAALADAIAALTPQPVADATAADALIGYVAARGVTRQSALNRQQQIAAVLRIPGLVIGDGVGVAVEVRPDPGIGQAAGARQGRTGLIEDVMAVRRLAADLGRRRARRIDAIERHLPVVAARQNIQRPGPRADDAEVLHQLQTVQPDVAETVRRRRLRIDVVTVRQRQIARLSRAG
ncbi:hypothetical protein D3C73_1127290 [compost metagenome]